MTILENENNMELNEETEIRTVGTPIDSIPLGALPLAYAYVPIQKYGDKYSDTEALQKGTLFKQLYRPWMKMM